MTKQTKIQESREDLVDKFIDEVSNDNENGGSSVWLLGRSAMKVMILGLLKDHEKVVKEEGRERIVEVLGGMRYAYSPNIDADGNIQSAKEERRKMLEKEIRNKALNEAIKIIKNIDKQG